MIPALALFGVAWIVYRAASQSITLDEANTFLFWVNTPDAAHWSAHSNNHILNSSLMRLAVFIAGPSHLALRAPALLGGFLYIGASRQLAHRLATQQLRQVLLFVCLVFNPFVMDYLVAARGYGLAAAFFLLALVQLLKRDNASSSSAVLISACCALSFAANFSTAYANAALWLIAAWRFTNQTRSARILIPLAIPGAAITIALCGHALIHYDKSQLIWGADSLSKMLVEMRDSTFQHLNPHLINPLLFSPFALISKIIPWLVLAAIAEATFRKREFEFKLLAALLLIPLACHWLQFQFFGVLLPYERTSLLFVVLLILVIGTLSHTRFATLALGLSALYFGGTLRHNYFREWTINSDIRQTFPILESESRRLHTREIVSDLNYTPSLNVYRLLNNSSVFDKVANHDRPISGKSIYVLPADQCLEFTQQERLTLRYRSPLSDYSIWLREPSANALLR